MALDYHPLTGEAETGGDLWPGVARYAELGFAWVCLTEHMPTENPALIPADESASGLDVDALRARFAGYFDEARRLAERYRGRIEIFVGFETEAYTGFREEVAALIARHRPDMIVGSVHHVHDVPFDYGAEEYARAVALAGGIEALYCDYFDTQLELIEAFEPAIVGHFDLIRIFDPDYLERWEVPAIRDRALRNLRRIGELGLILDLNVRALAKGASEPYVSAPWLEFAVAEGIGIAPGDDSHGVAGVGAHLDDGMRAFLDRGGAGPWPRPARGRHVGA